MNKWQSTFKRAVKAKAEQQKMHDFEDEPELTLDDFFASSEWAGIMSNRSRDQKKKGAALFASLVDSARLNKLGGVVAPPTPPPPRRPSTPPPPSPKETCAASAAAASVLKMGVAPAPRQKAEVRERVMPLPRLKAASRLEEPPTDETGRPATRTVREGAGVPRMARTGFLHDQQEKRAELMKRLALRQAPGSPSTQRQLTAHVNGINSRLLRSNAYETARNDAHIRRDIHHIEMDIKESLHRQGFSRRLTWDAAVGAVVKSAAATPSPRQRRVSFPTGQGGEWDEPSPRQRRLSYPAGELGELGELSPRPPDANGSAAGSGGSECPIERDIARLSGTVGICAGGTFG
mmetsp:Transcript_8457/g.27612  ORF Transcript_8457/g.27612 Transcript_8457/m.27612 type:complete len:348 (-) Transcript_8457:1451-2494(-)|eukprot:CAMPEP_0182853312 /NCGR_PEP_ID=MMETSP0034_2-20130328/634_1 /TAXON_ID=156128 /ORGANISM="Nephroselmis pyriformis, Strain CCMP717" /LENGTH=347 /DNA_ID=CAMNT_0024984075 /DNA_START=361 /DNA_END=1404 /DNA_ORIENTATION=+